MNLAPRDAARRQNAPRILALPTAWGRLAGAVLLLGAGLAALVDGRSLGRRLDHANGDRARLAAELAERQAAAEAIESGRARIARLRSARRRLVRWEEERVVLAELLRGMALGVGTGVVIEELRRESERVFIVGRTGAGSSAVTAATRSLGRVDRLEGLNLQWVEQTGDSGIPSGQRFSLAGAIRYFSPSPLAPGMTPAPMETGS